MSDTEPTPETPDSEIPSTAPQSKKRNVKLAAGIGVGVLVLAGVTALVVSLMQPSAVERAGEACSGIKPLQALLDDESMSSSDLDADEFADMFEGVVSVEDGGTTLIVNTKPEDEDALGLSSLALECVYEELDVPSHITARIGATRALDGRQDGEWDGFEASWGYHPDAGANLIVVQD